MLLPVLLFAVASGARSVTRSPAADSAGRARQVTIARPPLPAIPNTECDEPPSRGQAVEYSDWYARRLTIHRWTSYATLPLFAAEYALGSRLMTGSNLAGWVRPAHSAAAGAVGVAFGVNTLTGLWNLWDSRADPAGRSRRILHSALMLTADAGFALTGAIAGRAVVSNAGARRHRDVALASMSLSAAGTVLMWLWKN